MRRRLRWASCAPGSNKRRGRSNPWRHHHRRKCRRSAAVACQSDCRHLRADVTNTAWHTALKQAGVEDFRFHDLRHTWASWHRQAGTSCDELKDLGGWKSRTMVDRYAKFATENLLSAASRIERGGEGRNVVDLSRFCHV
ncbi:MAG: tyrosine-type recombinase/integrase [Burkholderiaceae bacterium]